MIINKIKEKILKTYKIKKYWAKIIKYVNNARIIGYKTNINRIRHFYLDAKIIKTLPNPPDNYHSLRQYLNN